MKIDIGRYREIPVYFDTNESLNSHILLLGKSGSGKTVESQRIITEIVKQGGTVIAFDLHQTLSEGEIFEKYRSDFDEYKNDIAAYDEGIRCELFTPLVYTDGCAEYKQDTICAIVDVFSRVLKLGCKQRVTLRQAISKVMLSGAYNTNGFRAVDLELQKIATETAENIREKLYIFFVHNIFRPGEFFIRPSKINVLRVSKFDLDAQEMLCELVLAYIWRLATTGRFNKNGLYIFIDEFQNMPSGKSSTLIKILTEGRKFNVNLVLATQQLIQSSSAVQQKLTQCGLMLLFQPDITFVNKMAKIIATNSDKEWAQILRTLARGEFVSVGPLRIGDDVFEQPLKISAVEM